MRDGGSYFIEGTLPETPDDPRELEPWTETTVIGGRRPRVDAYERVSGSAVYPLDVTLPGMLHAAILRCPHANALVKRVDASRAETMPGVRAVLTPSSPGVDIPWYRSRGGHASTLFDPHCRYEGEEVAAVAAETPYQARDALRAIDVGYETLPFVVDETKALEAGAPAIHEGGNRVGEPSLYERGDVTAGFGAADAVVERTFRTSCEIHTPMEVHGSVARWDGNRLTVWDTTQGVFAMQSSLAEALGLPLANVRVIGPYMGGGFGSKLELGKYSVIAALLARTTARPVKLFLTREETFLAVGNRPANIMTVKIGAKRDGTLIAIEFTSLGSGGAYPAGANSSFMAAELYRCANVRTRDTNVYINAGRARPMRAPGFPQCAWALEQAMDELADRLQMDPVELRLKNIPEIAQLRGNQPYTSTGLAECIKRGAERFGWAEARRRPRGDGRVRRGVGMAACFWGYGGGPPSTVIVKLFADGSVNLNMGAADIGTGTKTVMAMVVSEELGVPLEQIQIENADTATTQFATPSGGSKTVPSDSPAVRAAAAAVKERLLGMAAEQLGRPVADLNLRGGEVVSASEPDKKAAVPALEGLQRQGVVVGVGYRGPNPEGKIIDPFAAHFAEVEVNIGTGEVRIVRLVAAQDSGRPLNRLTYDSQVFGGMAMGVGFGMTEERVIDRQTGKMVNPNWHDYRIPTALDVPVEQSVVAIDPHDTECNTTGAKGLGEPATIPTAAAIANAIHDATGVRVTDAPASPVRLAALLAQAGKEG
jgi:CO/xanthine dehydrogenase Mo-binding subunit